MKQFFFCISLLIFTGLFIHQTAKPVFSQSGGVSSNTNTSPADPILTRRQPVTNEVSEFTVSRGESLGGFTYSNNGALTFNGKHFSPRVIVSKDITGFLISMLTQRKWAGVIGTDVDGQNKSFFLDTTNMTATPMQPSGSW